MKRFLLSIVAIVITSVCFAQDIIVQKDGSTIQAKVTMVTQSEVEYKKFNNQKGPTYTISTKDLQCINYENGTKDTFVSPSYNPNIVTNETATQFSNDQQLLKLYNNDHKNDQLKLAPITKAKTQRLLGYIGGAVLAAGGVWLVYNEFESQRAKSSSHLYKANGMIVAGGIAMAAVGVAGGAYLVIDANRKLKQLDKLSVSTIPFTEVPLFNKHVTANVDVIRDNLSKYQTLGLGVSYNF